MKLAFEYCPPYRIDNSIEVTVEHILNAVLFASRSTKIAVSDSADSVSSCPFQVDLCIAMGEPVEVKDEQKEVDLMGGDHDDLGDGYDDDDDGKEDPVDTDYVDSIGDIEAKLKFNHLVFEKISIQIGVAKDDLQSGMTQKRKIFAKYTNNPHQLHRQRLIAVVDRREKNDSAEKAFVFKPPADSRDIPNDAVYEWNIAASINTILPGMNPDDNIGASTDCGGGMLILSIHALEQDVVKAYLYWNGKVMRFMPEDIKTVFPLTFNMDYPGNRKFLKSGILDGHIKQMQKVLVDREFESFSGQQ